MKIEILVKPGARKQGVEKTDDGLYKVSVRAAPDDGKANSAVIEELAKYFVRSKSSIVILRGKTSRKKLVEIL